MIVIIGLMIGISVWKFVLNKDEDENNNTPSNNTSENTNNTPSNNNSTTGISTYNGVYKLDNATLKLYAVSDSSVAYSCTSGFSSASGSFDYADGKLNYSFFDDVYSAHLDDNKNLVLESTSDIMKSGTYTKSSDYSEDDYYKDNYGNLSLLDNEFNGKYTLNSDYINAYQPKEGYVKVSGLLGESGNIEFDLEKDGDKYVTELFDDYYELTFNGDSLHVVVKENGSVTYDNTLTRTGKLTKKDIISNFMSGYFE